MLAELENHRGDDQQASDREARPERLSKRDEANGGCDQRRGVRIGRNILHRLAAHSRTNEDDLAAVPVLVLGARDAVSACRRPYGANRRGRGRWEARELNRCERVQPRGKDALI